MRTLGAIALLGLVACEDTSTPLLLDTAADAPATVVLDLSPPRGGLGTEMTVQVTSNLPVFVFGETDLAMGEGIAVDSVTVFDEWTLGAEIAIDPDTELGVRDAVVSVEGDETTLSESFLVVAEGLTVTPSNGRMGELVEVELRGTGTTWEDGNTWASFGDGVEVRWVRVTDESTATATIAIAPDAVPGLRDVHAEDPPDVVTAWDAFTVDRAVLSAICQAEPLRTGSVGSLRVDALGDLLNPSMTVELWDDGGLANDTFLEDLIVGDPTWLEARVRVSNAARPGTRDLYLEANGDRFLVPDCLTIEQAPINPMTVRGYTYFLVNRDISPTSGAISEQVTAFAQFYVPLDPPCFGSGGSGSGYPSPFDANGVWPNPIPGDPSDCPSVRMVSAGEHVWFESDRNIVTLDKRERPARNQIWYVGRDLTLADYVFDNLYDLRLEGDPTGLPAAFIEDVQPTVKADYTIVEPSFSQLTHPRSQPLDYAWTPAQSYPEGQFRVFVYGTLADGRGGFGGAIPWDDGQHYWSANNLAEFAEGPLEWRFESRKTGPTWSLPFSEPPQYSRSFTAVRHNAAMVLE